MFPSEVFEIFQKNYSAERREWLFKFVENEGHVAK